MEGARLLVAEIDPAVTDAAVDRMWLDPTHPALEIAHRDARALLQSLPPELVLDHNGYPRITGSAIDLGAHERL